MCVYNKYAKIHKSIQTYKFFFIYFKKTLIEDSIPHTTSYNFGLLFAKLSQC